MSRYFAAFDGAVAAAGYNAFHELIALGVPSLFVPMERQTDDQAARARWAAAAGVGLGVAGAADASLEHELDRLLDEPQRAAIATALGALEPPAGAAEAARWLAAVASGEEDPAVAAGPDSGAGKRGSFRAFRRRWGTFVGSIPQTAYRLGRQQLTKPRPRTVIEAFGLGGETIAAVAPGARRDAGSARAGARAHRLVRVRGAARARRRLRARAGARIAPGGARRGRLRGLSRRPGRARARRAAAAAAHADRPLSAAVRLAGSLP